MNIEVKTKIFDKIKEYGTIILSRHKRPDGDAVGSSMGLYKIIKQTYPEKRVFLDNEDYSDYVAFLGGEGEHPTDEDYMNALVIVLDTGNIERVSNSRVCCGRELVKIDHHIDNSPYGDVSWVEEERSSTCEMIVDFYLTFSDKLKIDKSAAFCLYTGMITDSGRFRFRGTNGDTLRCAGALLDVGVDTERIFSNLYIDEFAVVKFKADMMRKVEFTENGVAHIRISRALRKRHKMTLEDASAIVSIMDSIKGCLIWIAFIENDDGSKSSSYLISFDKETFPISEEALGRVMEYQKEQFRQLIRLFGDDLR